MEKRIGFSAFTKKWYEYNIYDENNGSTNGKWDKKLLWLMGSISDTLTIHFNLTRCNSNQTACMV